MVGCSQVLKVSAVNEAEPSLSANNIALIRLSRPVSRQTIRPSDAGLKHGNKFELWKVSTEDKVKQSFIKHFTCDVIKESYANPFNDNEYAPNSALGNCFFKDSDGGTPTPETEIYPGAEGGVVMYNGKFVGILGQQAFTQEAFEKLQADKIAHPEIPLRSMNIVTNLACIGDFFNGNTPSECHTNWTLEHLKEKRKAIASSDVAAGLSEAKARIIDSTKTDTGKKMEWYTQFSKVDKQQIVTKHIPKCYIMSPGNDWLKKEFHRFILGYRTKQDTKMSIDGYIIEIKLDGLLMPRAEYVKAPAVIEYGMTIRPKDISKKKDSELIVKGKYQGADFTDAYPAIPICPQ